MALDLFTAGERLAYAAGLIDGEGCIHLGNSVTRVVMGMTRTTPLLKLQKQFGGTIRPRSHIPAGNKPQWVWEVVGPAAADMLHKLLPYLEIKGEEAAVAIMFQAMLSSKRERTAYGTMISRSSEELAMRRLCIDECKSLKQFYG